MTAIRLLAMLIAAISIPGSAAAGDAPRFLAGSAGQEITPPPGLPLWGYASRHEAPATGTLDSLLARAVVIEAGGSKLAIVAIDLGRAPTPPMMATIRREVAARAGIAEVLVVASHTHHGPVIELIDRPGRGRGRFEAAVAYAGSIPGRLVEVILAADRDRRPARIGVASGTVDLNRNRQAKRDPKPTDPSLQVVRLDDLEGRPIAVLVSYAAHATLTDPQDFRYSADYPGALRARVEAELTTRCLFLPGAGGDLAAKPPEGVVGAGAFGRLLADRAVALAGPLETKVPEAPSIAARTETIRFATRVDLENPLVVLAYGKAFFPELVAALVEEHRDGVLAELNVVLLNGQVAIVAASGEFFCEHANRLRSRSAIKPTLFLGYCNGHQMYFPTIEAAYEGGYGADPGISLAEIGAGERMMDRALILLYTLQGKFAAERR